jgi:hypothetical protein
VTSDAAATRWQFRPSPRQAALEIDDAELLRWVQAQAGDVQALQAATFCRRYERTWTNADLAVRRVVCERGEVLGARVATAVAALLVPTVLLLAFGASALQATGLTVALAVAGAAALLWKGALVVPRVAMLQAFLVAAVAIGPLGIMGALMLALYLPALAMACAAVLGARAGRAVAELAYARRMQGRLAVPAAPAAPARREDAVAA